MDMNIRALAFDTGGTILDWHGALCDAFGALGRLHGLERDWHAVTNAYRRLSMQAIVGQVHPMFNMDDVHAENLDKVISRFGLEALPLEARQAVLQRWYELPAWPDLPPALARLRRHLVVASMTMLPLALAVSVSRCNALHWDAVISCEMIGFYKPQPEAYLRTAQWLALPPSQILMVACHNFDLDAARGCGYRTAFVRRPDEWGPGGPPDPMPNPACDFVVDNFMALADILDAQRVAGA